MLRDVDHAGGEVRHQFNAAPYDDRRHDVGEPPDDGIKLAAGHRQRGGVESALQQPEDDLLHDGICKRGRHAKQRKTRKRLRPGGRSVRYPNSPVTSISCAMSVNFTVHEATARLRPGWCGDAPDSAAAPPQ